MRVRLGFAVVMVAALVLSSWPAAAHESSRVNAQQRVFGKNQTLEESTARVQLRVTNRRFTRIRRLVCETVISDRWAHPTTGEVREFSEDWFLVIRNFQPRTRVRSRKSTISVSHPELTTDPSWQPQGVTVKTKHCHAR
jgi:hypothetical protein